MKKVKERVDVHNTHRLAVMQYDVSTLIDGLNEHRRLQVDWYAVITRLLQGIASDKVKEIDHPVEPTPSDTCDRIRDRVSCEISNSREISSTPLPTLSNLQLTFEHFKDSAIQTAQLEAHHSYLALDLPNKPEVQAWLRSQKSALLWIDGYANSRASKWTTEFSVDVLLGAKRQNSTVLFYFGDIATDDVAEASSSYLASPKAIIHSFIAQLLRQHASLAGNDAGWLTPERWTEARRSTRAAWTLLYHLLQSLSSKERIIYLIIDSVDALSSVHNHSHNLEPLLRRLSTLVTSSPSSDNKGPNTCLVTKVLLTSVAGSAHSLLFPPNAASIPSSHYIAHIPQTYGQHNVALAPSHLRKPTAKRLVRLPDSDDEFGLKPADSFGFSDDEENGSLVFSSEDEMENSQGVDDGTKKAGREVCMRNKMAQHSPRKMNGKSVRSTSESSQELVFSDDEKDDAGKRRGDADDIEFSSSSEEDLTISPR